MPPIRTLPLINRHIARPVHDAWAGTRATLAIIPPRPTWQNEDPDLQAALQDTIQQVIEGNADTAQAAQEFYAAQCATYSWLPGDYDEANRTVPEADLWDNLAPEVKVLFEELVQITLILAADPSS